MNNRLTVGVPDYITANIEDRNRGISIPLVTAPQSLSESIAAQYAAQDVPGGSRPLINYSSTGARKLNFSLKLTDEMMPSGYSIQSYVAALKALVYPMYTKGAVKSPEQLLTIGNITLLGGCESVNVSWEPVYINNTLIRCSVDLSFMEFRESCPGSTTIANEYEEQGVSYV